jgi:hypothetical protein
VICESGGSLFAFYINSERSYKKTYGKITMLFCQDAQKMNIECSDYNIHSNLKLCAYFIKLKKIGS